MSNYSSEAVINFWSHFPNGISYRELCQITPEQSEAYQREFIPKPSLETEVALVLVEVAPVTDEMHSAA